MLGYVVGWSSIAMGAAGVVYHLDSQFFYQRTIKSLTYAAPFVAPLAYVGLGCLGVVTHVTLQCERAYDLREQSVSISLARDLLDTRKLLNRYYDLDDREFEVYGRALVRLIDFVLALLALRDPTAPLAGPPEPWASTSTARVGTASS